MNHYDLTAEGGYDFRTAQFGILFRSREGVAVVSGGHLVLTDRVEGSLVEPTLWLDVEHARQLGKLLSEHGLTPKPPDDLTPTKQHLADAIAVRDRLLTLVEKT